MEKKLYELKIDPELRDYIPPLKQEEYDLLAEQIISEGCTEALVVWNGVIVDGHNRYSICHEYGIPFEYIEMNFSNKEQAMLWMARKQLGRRNLMPYQKCELIFPIESAVKEEAESLRRKKISETMKARKTGQISAPSSKGKKSRDTLSDMAGMSHDTYEKAKIISQEGDAEAIENLRKGKAFINTVYRSLMRKQGASENKQKPTEHEPEIEENEQEPIVAAGSVPFEPIVHMDGSIEVPDMREKPEREPRPYQYVRDQVHFAIENMLKEMKIGLNWLRDEDTDKIEELLEMLDDGFDRAESLIKEMEDK